MFEHRVSEAHLSRVAFRPIPGIPYKYSLVQPLSITPTKSLLKPPPNQNPTMQLSVLVTAVVYLVAIASASPHDLSRKSQGCGRLTTGKHCGSPGVKDCCSYNSPTIVVCDDNSQIEFEHCHHGLVCAVDEAGTGVTCLAPE